jgi:hypothetical protein
MNPLGSCSLAVACLVLAGCGANQPAPAAPEPTPAPVVTKPAGTEAVMPLATIDPSILEQAKDEGGFVAIVRVTSSKIENAGTRSEAARIEAEVLRSIHGTLAGKFSLRSYTKGGDPVLKPGTVHAVALFTDPRFAPAMDLIGHAPCDEARVEESAQAHMKLLQVTPR